MKAANTIGSFVVTRRLQLGQSEEHKGERCVRHVLVVDHRLLGTGMRGLGGCRDYGLVWCGFPHGEGQRLEIAWTILKFVRITRFDAIVCFLSLVGWLAVHKFVVCADCIKFYISISAHRQQVFFVTVLHARNVMSSGLRMVGCVCVVDAPHLSSGALMLL
jgi:hypothetical protein